MKTFLIVAGIIAFLALIYYFYNKNKNGAGTTPVNKLSVTTRPNVVIINKKPGEQWTDAELKAQGYSEKQIADAKNNVYNALSLF